MGRAGQIRESPLMTEVALTEAIPALGNAPERKIVPVTRKNRMAIRTPRELQLSTEIDPAMYKGGGKVNPHHPADRKAAPVKEGTGSQGQKVILADFLVEKPDENTSNTSVVETPPEPWTLFTDGSSCVDGSGAKYEALIAGLRIVAQMGVQNVQVNVDSKLVANQVLGTYVAKEENMIKYLEKVKGLVSGFANFSINQVPRSKNKKAYALSKIASTSFAHLSEQVLVKYLKDGTLPEDKKEVSKLCIKARQYELMEGILYKRSFLKPWLRCVGPLQANYVIREIHEGSCSMHAGPRSVVAKAIRANRSLGKGIKARLGEAVIPAEIGMPTCRTATVDTVHNDEELRLNLDLLEERWECAAICEAKAKMKMEKYYNARVRGVAFRPGDFVYRSNDASHVAAGGKLRSKWEGPYEVTEALGDGAYKLRTINGTDLPCTWNIANLKKCYL
ncbi:reverse transcriptase domain-containing protein [Tanacetum coccineum]